MALRSYFMFGLLDYETWSVYADDVYVATVTVNAVDRTTSITFDPMGHGLKGMPEPGRYLQWARWLIDHDGGPHPRGNTAPRRA